MDTVSRSTTEKQSRLSGFLLYQRFSVPLAASILVEGAQKSGPGRAVFCATLITLVLYPTTPLDTLAIWFSATAGAGLYGIAINTAHKKINPDFISLNQLMVAEYRCVLYSFVTGAAWGGISLLLSPGEDIHNLLIFMLLFGFVANAVSNWLFGILRGMTGLIIGFIVYITGLPSGYPDDWHTLAAGSLVFGLVTFFSSWNRALTYYENLQLREENEQLLAIQQAETVRANKANKAKSALLAAASHDLRQPLHAVMLMGDAIMEKLQSRDQIQLMGNLLDAGKVLSNQFGQLMDLSRIESGDYEPIYQPLSIRDLIDECIITHTEPATHKGLKLSARIDRRLENRAINSDISLLRRIVHNLVDNAIKYSEQGSVLLLVRWRSRSLVIQVFDQGIGIAPEKQTAVFKPYTQIGKHNHRSFSGLGLGLSIVEESAIMLGLKINICSHPGRGSVFAIDIPHTQLCDQAPVKEPICKTNTLSSPPERILFVDDDPKVSEALIAWADAKGFKFNHYSNPANVPDSLLPDRIVCDIHLPNGQNGIDWLLHWLNIWPEARGVLVSGDTSEKALVRVEEEGLMLLTKPLDPDLLFRSLTLAGS